MTESAYKLIQMLPAILEKADTGELIALCREQHRYIVH